eukprot:4978155-Amphidinium_carterae.1
MSRERGFSPYYPTRGVNLRIRSSNVLNDLMVFQTFTSGYSPQSSGAAEVNVRIIKQVMRRLLETASLK